MAGWTEVAHKEENENAHKAVGICEEEGREVREEKIQKESKMAKNLDLTGFDGNILAQNLKTQKGSL